MFFFELFPLNPSFSLFLTPDAVPLFRIFLVLNRFLNVEATPVPPRFRFSFSPSLRLTRQDSVPFPKLYVPPCSRSIANISNLLISLFFSLFVGFTVCFFRKLSLFPPLCTLSFARILDAFTHLVGELRHSGRNWSILIHVPGFPDPFIEELAKPFSSVPLHIQCFSA